ncbi:Sec1-like snare protein [Mycena pura]|uniref:Sec1-like snare protein n=1 Tax=Mycena pura TaxID=153505 RepID=A0AAD6V4Y4_9AGAR|nr:Sec1-like snare protein [Mycena pura]
MASLIATVRSKFLEAIRSVQPPGKWKILVVDEHSQKLLGSVLKQFDILEENVTLIESITNYRDPQPEFEALYLLMPTSQNIERIIKDFSGSRQYAAAHLFFVDGMSFLLQELFINFWAAETQTFSLQAPELFFSLYSPPRSDAHYKAARARVEEELLFASKIIANVCITLNEFPFVRYYVPPYHPPLGALKPHASTRAPPPPEASSRWRTNLARGAEARAYEVADGDFGTKILAFFVQNALESYKKANPDFAKPSEPPRPRGTLIITDRAMDMVAPFVHEFTYQAMATDLLPIEGGSKYTYKFQSSLGEYEDKTATLSDADAVWTGVRHMHMREAIDKLMADFNSFLEENAVFKGEGAASLNDMKDMLAGLPQFQEQREKFSLHLSMAQECMGIFERDKLPVVAAIEQDCATGTTAEGKNPKNLVQDMVPLLDSREVINLNKVRIVALYIQHRDGVPDEDRRRLYQHARLSVREQDAVNALVYMGVRISRGPGDRDLKKKLTQKKSKDEEYELSRFKPALRSVLEDHVADKLDKTLFPYVRDEPSAGATSASSSRTATPVQATSLRSQKPSWHKAARPGGAAGDSTRGRLLVFVAGGMTYSEIREAYQLSATLNRDIYIGSTHSVTPIEFISDLQSLELGGTGSKAAPNGLRDGRPGRSFQEFYDERYYTRDAPPPARPAPAAAPPGRQVRPAARAPPMESTASYSSYSSNTSQAQEDKRKKKGLFRF